LKQAGSLLDTMQASRRVAHRIFTAIGFVVGCVAIYFSVCVLIELSRVPSLSFLENYQPVGFIQIYDRDNKLICKIEGTEKRKIIPLSQVTPHLQRAVLAAEDHHFYEHHGLDFFGIARATIANILARHTVQGGSTITQQLAKNLFFESSQRSLATKVAEAVVSAQLEGKFSKEKILELYLNEVYFGNGAYGIEQAANLYFDKPAAELDVSESAYIAGLIRWPARGGQRQYLEQNYARRNDVIAKMLEYGYITQYQADVAKSEELTFRRRPAPKIATNQITKYPYYISYVLDLVRQMYTEGEMQRHGLRVYTNMDQAAQQAAERVLSAGIASAPPGCTQGALVSINVKDGAVVALVGGVGDFMKHQWNCAVNPHTTGSAFKPFVYLAGFNRGAFTPQTYIEDTPLVIPRAHEADYKPKNFDGKYMGDITIAEALAYSRNTCAVRAAQRVGLDAVIDTARLAGIREKIAPEISLALGCSAASPLEMAGAYATLARGGVYVKPSTIRRIDDKHGNVLRAFYYYPERVFETGPVAQIVDVMQEVVAQGTGTQARLGDRPVAGKTGTSDQAKDLWFVGFTPDLVTAVWGGNPDNKPIYGSHVTGGTVMARIWANYNRAYYARHDVPASWFVACTHLAGNIKFPTRKSTDEKETVAKKMAEVRPKAKVVRYEDIDPTYHEPAHRPVRRAAAVRPGRGVTEYRWSR
jgi:penicillin-binding protein 1A